MNVSGKVITVGLSSSAQPHPGLVKMFVSYLAQHAANVMAGKLEAYPTWRTPRGVSFQLAIIADHCRKTALETPQVA